MPTLQDVANYAGVSTATVSKVLSNTPYFTEETRIKVMDAVKAVGYVPNLAARALTTGKTQIIGVIFPYIYEAIFEDALVMSFLKGIEMECTARQYNILLNTPRVDVDGVDMQFQHMIQSGYIDGMISIDSLRQTSFAEIARERNIPNVVIGYHESPYFVRCNDAEGSQKIMDHILSLGHRQIGLITVPEQTHFGIDERIFGISQAARDYGMDVAVFPRAYGDYSIKSGEKAAQDLLRQSPDLTAIVAINDRMAIGAIEYLKKIGKQIPDDIAVAGFDNIEISNLLNPTLTTVDQRPVEQGQLAARMLFDLLNDNPPKPVVLDAPLIVRASTAQPRR